MTVTTFYPKTPATDDGSLSKVHSDYATARAGASPSASWGGNGIFMGQQFASPNYTCRQAFMRFPTASIPDNDVIEAVTLGLYLYNDQSATDFVLNCYGIGEDGGSWINHSAFGSTYPLVATLDSSGIGANGMKQFTILPAMLDAIVKTGYTGFCFVSARQVAGTPPTGNEYMGFYMSEQGTIYRPTLVVTHGSGSPVVTDLDPDSAQVGAQIKIIGTGLTGATNVLFGEVAASQFTVDSDTQITATVPAQE